MRSVLPALLLLACGRAPQVGDDADTDPALHTDAAETDVETDEPRDSGPPSETDAEVPEASCTLGWGEDVFHGIADGDPVPVVLGTQGRWHVPGGVRCTGIEPGRSLARRPVGEPGVEPAVRWRIETPEGGYLGGYPLDGQEPLHRPMRTPDGPALLDELLVMWGTQVYEEAIDRAAVMTFEAVDRDGVTVRADVSIQLVEAAALIPAR